MKKSMFLIVLTLIVALSGCAATSAEAPADTADATTIAAQTTVPEVTTSAPIVTTTTAAATSAEATTTTVATTAPAATTAAQTTAPAVTTSAPITTTTAAATTAKPVQTTAPAATTAAVTTAAEEYKGFTEADCLYIISECEKYMEAKGYDYKNISEVIHYGDCFINERGALEDEKYPEQYGCLFQHSTWHTLLRNVSSLRDTPETIIYWLKGELDWQATTGEGTMVLDYCPNKVYNQWAYDLEGTPRRFDEREGFYTFIICVL